MPANADSEYHVRHLLVRHQSRHPLTHVRASRRVEVEDEHEEEEVTRVVTPADEPVLDRHEQNDHDDKRTTATDCRAADRSSSTCVRGRTQHVRRTSPPARHEVDDANKVHAVVDETDVRVDLLDTAADNCEQREEEHAHEVVLRVAPVRELLLLGQRLQLVPKACCDGTVVECGVPYKAVRHFAQPQRVLGWSCPVRCSCTPPSSP
ncbi:hypothetical protein GQ600_26464 [Phytophthora cactorum]|nr:hypothetical protein GQ600_26464 [Phytophthora cactorum]